MLGILSCYELYTINIDDVVVDVDDDAHSDDDAEVGHRSQSHAGQGGVLQHLYLELVVLPPMSAAAAVRECPAFLDVRWGHGGSRRMMQAGVSSEASNYCQPESSSQ